MKCIDLVSVIIPIYNAEKSLEKCVNSVINQTYKDLEIILVDDGSTDKSLTICKSFKDKRVKVYTQKNSGPSCARNLGLKSSDGNYVIFVDSDDYMENNMIELMLEKLKSENSDLCICGYYTVSKNIKIRHSIGKINDNDFRKIMFEYENNVGGYLWNKLSKKSCIKKMFRNNIAICEDEVFWVDNSNNIKKISTIENNLYNYVLNDDSLINSNDLSSKKITVLDALLCIINENISDEVTCKKKYKFVHDYMFFMSIANKKQCSFILNKYKKIYLNYYKDILKSNISLKLKIKIIVRKKFFYVYKLYKTYERRK